MMLAGTDLDPALCLLVASRVMPVGHSAFVRKADVPTYLVGDASAVARIAKLVPRPNETYVNLQLPLDTTEIDRYVEAIEKQRIEAERARRRERREQEQRSDEPRLPGMQAEGAQR
jgi:hypothetical protein